MNPHRPRRSHRAPIAAPATALAASIAAVVSPGWASSPEPANPLPPPRHWAFQPVVEPPVPRLAGAPSAWARSPVDAFVLERLENAGLAPSPETDRRTLLRRLSTSLTGLPPTAAEADAFVADGSPDAYTRAVDRLLNAPQFGERWGRHWLDVARYADTKGYVFQEERRFPYAFTYRDWVVDAFNRDAPYDRFLVAQIAADHAVKKGAAEARDLAALGFLTLGRRFLKREPDIIDDRIDVITRGTMGLTVACARCHDHKYDPVPTADYYSLYGVFASSTEPSEAPLLGEPDPSPEYRDFVLGLKEREQAVPAFLDAKLADLRSEEGIKSYLQAVYDGRALTPERLDGLAQERKLMQGVARRWKERLDRAGEGDLVFGLFNALAQVEPESFSEKLTRILESPTGADENSETPINPSLAEDLSAAAPSSMADLVAVFAKALAAADGSDPHPEPHREALRQVLRGGGSPVALSHPELERMLNVKDAEHLRGLRRKVVKYQATAPGAPPRAMALVDKPSPVEPHVFERGSPGRRGARVPRQFLAVLAGPEREPFREGSGRGELAEAIASPRNPLTARVFVNRVWHHLFGVGLVTTPSDFGTRCDPPEHPELLDYLAARFVADGWSVKRLIRSIVLSSTFRQRSDDRPEGLAADPENRLYWKMNRTRLDFEAWRDSLLACSGHLDLRVGGRPVELTQRPHPRRRTLYGFVDRQNLSNVFRTFDFASPDHHSPRRFHTTVPQQALFNLNSPFVLEVAARVAIASARDTAAAVEHGAQGDRLLALYRRVLGRAPDTAERELANRFLGAESGGATEDRWAQLAQALLVSNEFSFVD